MSFQNLTQTTATSNVSRTFDEKRWEEIYPFSTFSRNRNVMDTIFIDYSDEKIWETNQETPLYLRKRKKR